LAGEFSNGNDAITSATTIQPESNTTTQVAAVIRNEDAFARGVAWLALTFGAILAASMGNPPRGALRAGLLLIGTGSVMLTGIANDAVLLFVAVEMVALAATAALFIDAEAQSRRNAATQSLAVGIVGMALFGLGVACIVRLTGSTNLADMQRALAFIPPSHAHRAPAALPTAGTVACVCFLASLCVRLVVAPFQMAAAEIFDGAGTWSAGFMTLLPRAAAFVAMVRLLIEGMPKYLPVIQTGMTAIALVTLLMSAFAALTQRRIRRLVGFALTAQGGLVLACLASAAWSGHHPNGPGPTPSEIPDAIAAALLCFLFDTVAIGGILAIVGSPTTTETWHDDFDDLRGSLADDPMAAVALAVLSLSLIGLPPLAGFWGRFGVITSLLAVTAEPERGFLPHQNIDFVVLTLIVIGALIALAGSYLKIVRTALAALGSSRSTARTRDARGRVGALIAGALIVLGLLPGFSARLLGTASYSQHSRPAQTAATDRAAARAQVLRRPAMHAAITEE
jgi:NADH-quinone oxidoreductase subunit N